MTVHPTTPEHVAKLIAEKGGIMLDLGCGECKQPNYVGMDIRPMPMVDIVHDFETIPYPLPDECCVTILASHVLEHVNPARFGFVNVMNELWRIMKPGGKLMISTPYAGSPWYFQDPTHVNPINEITIGYFAPKHVSGLWGIYKPKPWDIKANAWHVNGNLEVILEKLRAEDFAPSFGLEEAQVLLNKKDLDTKIQLETLARG